MRGKKAVFLTLIILAVVLQPPLAMGDPGWLVGWDKRVQITIDSGDVDTVLTNFPVFIYLSGSSGINGDDVTFIFDEVGDSYLKIAVTLSDGITECYVEIEGWDLGNEEAWLWAKIASISNITDTEIYLYYDNDHANNTAKVGPTNTVPAENVWDANFIAVYHMADKDANEIYDSTSNDVDGTKRANDDPIEAPGQMGKAQDFDGSAWILLANLFPTLQNVTMEGWLKADIIAGNLWFIRENNDAIDTLRAYIIGGDILLYWRTDGVTVNPGIAFSDTTYWHYLAGVRGGTSVIGYWDGAYNAGFDGVVGAGTIQDFTQRVLGSRNDLAGGHYDGKLDEIRFSNVARGEAWIEVTYETGTDHLLDFGEEEDRVILTVPTNLFGAGFNSSTPYTSLFWDWNSSQDIDFFEVQNSTDGVSWDYLGQNTTREYHDFRVLNGTERYYRVRACNDTGVGWDNSTWSDTDFEKTYFIIPLGEDECLRHSYNANSIAVIIGTLNDGNLASTYAVDGDWYNVSETNDSPGIDIRVNFTGVCENSVCGCLDIYHMYTGHSQHEIAIEIYNFNSSTWVSRGAFLYNETAGWVCVGLGDDPDIFVNNGTLWARFYHADRGHLNHELHIDSIKLNVACGEACPPCEEAPALVAMGKFYALAIILLILGLLLGLGMRKR